MLADADEIDANLVGEDGLLDEVADDLRRMQRLSVRTVGDIAEGVETEFDRLNHSALYQVQPRKAFWILRIADVTCWFPQTYKPISRYKFGTISGAIHFSFRNALRKEDCDA